jgi:(5-formylfuran-3-yl)methyl phosphate synthase
MTLLLASVTDIDEAEIAVEHGADIVDLKDPSKGALGAWSVEAVRAGVRAVAGRRPVSAVTGDLPMDPEVVVAAVHDMAHAGVDFVKVGLFPGPRRIECIRALSALARSSKIVGVVFADAEPAFDLVPVMAECGFAGAMLDTAHKGTGRLIDRMDVATLKDFVGRCRSNGLTAGLAGSLEAPDVPRLLLLEPDLLGFRGALCVEQDRRGRIDAAALRMLRELIPLDPRSRLSDQVVRTADYRLLAARGYYADAGKDGATDRVFVHDLVLPIRIGAYAREREKAQNVRFNVDVMITRASHAAEDMRDVFSYDLITDTIRMIVAKEHIPLVETLAERIADAVLAHPRVVNVTVRTEKLDVGPGGVGVEIKRERHAEAAKVYQLYPAASDRSAGTKD